MPLKIYASNRMENLVKALAGVLGTPLSSPFAAETIIVQSKGMQRWLAMELAKRFGVWANCNYPFPNTMIWRLFKAALPELPDTASFSPEVMTWRVMGLLPGFLEQKEFAPLRRYLADDREGLKRFQLAGKIADSFDQYTLFRPEMLCEWEAGGGDDWQAALWREMAVSGEGRHRGRLKEEYCRQAGKIAPDGSGMPERIAVFGISYLPKYHMDILAATAKTTDVSLFLLSPTREYWADIVSDRAMARMKPEERLFRFEGNPLLASLGKLGRDFSDMVIEIDDAAVARKELYNDPGDASLLTAVQSDILNLRGAEDGSDKRRINLDDRSVQIHSCHSPMREIEALHDNLLALLENTDGLAPRDMVVMTPDIETYAPYISAVFDGCQDPSQKIPYSIADRNITNEGEIAEAIMKLLALPGSRLKVPQVLDIIQSAPVRRCFDLVEDELETIRGWLEDTRVRWGVDERDRAGFGLPGYSENSWRAGLERCLLGYAMPEEGGRLFNGKLPYDEMEGTAVQTLGKFVDFIGRITDLAGNFLRPRTLSEWRDELRTLMKNFIAIDDGSARELATVAGLLENIGALEAASGFMEKVELGVIRSWLSARLAQEEKGLGFMTGGVTFCAMLPMRSIPARVVALIGMNDGAFPRQSRSPGFDMIARNPCRGDRSLRDEDRYLFLEAILSARDCLYISFIGQSIKDNSEIPPSVLVSEFMDAIDKGFTVGEELPSESRLVTKHRLQAFSSGYFNGKTPLFSYSPENCAALLEKRANPWKPEDFISMELDPPADEWKDIPLARLVRFFANPAGFLVENRLGIRLEDAAAPLGEREPFNLAGLEAYNLNQELLKISLEGGDVWNYLPVARCKGLLPPARHGAVVFSNAVEMVSDFAATVQNEIAGMSCLPALDFELDQGSFRLTGRLDQIWPGRMIRCRCAKMKAKDMVRTWIEHLVLNAVRQEGHPRETMLLMTGRSVLFRPVEDAAGILRVILDLYWEGLTSPLRFFPESSLEYAKKLEWKLERARAKWKPGYNGASGEGDDPYLRLCFGQTDPFNHDFERVSRALLEPLLIHQSQD